MRSYTETRYEGEELGPVDWSHPMVAEEEARRPGLVALLREAEKNPEAFEATTDGGWPRVGWGPVLRVVMYDGWPFWKSTPTLVYRGWDGLRYSHFSGVSEVRRLAMTQEEP